MVGLDFTLLDKSIISYISFLSHLIEPLKIYFINIQNELEIPNALKNDYPGFFLPQDEFLIREMKEVVKAYFKDYESFDIEYKIIEGSPAREMLHLAHVKNIDLLVMGRKKELRGHGILTAQLVRKVPCSVLFIPEKPKKRLKEIFICNDFSEYSRIALEEAIRLTEKDPEITIKLQHVYHVPSAISTTKIDPEEYKGKVIQHLVSVYNDFVKNIDLKNAHIHPVFKSDKNMSITDTLSASIAREKCDLAIIGSRGKSMVRSVFLGSTTERLLRHDIEYPILVAKRKKMEYNFLEMLGPVRATKGKKAAKEAT